MLVLDGKRIIRMTKEGIAYLDEEAFEQFIYFSECYENDLKRRLSADYWEKLKQRNKLNDSYWDVYIKNVKSSKEIAVNIHELCIEFYTEPRIRFIFASQDEWDILCKHIHSVGWRTHELLY